MLDACYLAVRCTAPPTAAEVQSDVVNAYRAHAGAKFPAYECVPMPDAVNLQHLGLPTAFCFLPKCYSLGNHRGQLFGPWIQA